MPKGIEIFLTFFLLGLPMSSAKSSIPDIKEIPLIYVKPLGHKVLLSNGFEPHGGFEGTNFLMEPLHRPHSPSDYVAWHDESWDQLEKLFDKAWGWPREMSETQNARDLEYLHYYRFLNSLFYSYTVLTKDGQKVIGSLYIMPGNCGIYQAHAFYWISTPYRGSVEATFHEETQKWLETQWPWAKVYYPGPDLSDEKRGEAYFAATRGICL